MQNNGNNNVENWFDDYIDQIEEFQTDQYDITSSPNDFNVLTIYNYLEKGAIKVPAFQRNYVWDIIRASKLIESLILGLPVPQIFLYEKSRNEFQVIDGQQRLMSIYYFIKQRFPKKDKRVELRRVFEQHGQIPENILHNDEYFSNFRLKLPEKLPDNPNRFSKLSYATLDDYKTQFELRPIRNVIVKQSTTDDDERKDSAIFEIFNRLNSGGINLKPQEIRMSLYHSDFYNMLFQINSNQRWRILLNWDEPDLHMKDIEIILRAYAMLIDVDNYAPSLVKFLNQFSRKCQSHTQEQNEYLKKLFESFLESTTTSSNDVFINKKNQRFNIALFEAVFYAICKEPFNNREFVLKRLDESKVRTLEEDDDFVRASLEGTTSKANVRKRLQRAELLIN